MLIDMGMKLQGYLLGYEVLQNGLVVKTHKYDTPVKNLVVNTGKDFLMRAANSLSFVAQAATVSNFPRFGRGYFESESGVLSFCGRGSGATASTVGDTALQSQIGNHTSNILSADPNTGTRFDRETGKVIMRVTHDHETEVADRNINELGWFGRQNGAAILFSRIVLPATITVLTGQSLRTIYQLEVSITPVVSTPTAPTITGWTTDGDYRWGCAFPATSSTFATHTAAAFGLFDTISTTNVCVDVLSAIQNYSGGGGLLPHLGGGDAPATMGQVAMYGTAQTFNTFGTPEPHPTSSSVLYTAFCDVGYSTGTATATVQDYVLGDYYRDSVYVFEPNWTGYSSISIYAIRIRGLMYIFDAPQTKTNTQRLTLTYRISVS